MRKTTLLIGLLLLITGAASAQITEIIDATGDGAGNTLSGAWGIAVGGPGNAYVAGYNTDNAFKITPGGVITEIIDATGDGSGNTLDGAYIIAVDSSGNVYVSGQYSDNAFKITSGGVITEIIDATGDGTGNTLTSPTGIAVDGSGNVYVAGLDSNNAFKITSGGVITEIINVTGDGAGNTLNGANGIAVDESGNVYVAGSISDNAFKITPGGVITEFIDATGDGAGNTLREPRGIAVGESGNAYVAGFNTDNAFKITPGGVITEIIDATGDGAGNTMDGAAGIAVDGSGNVYVADYGSDNAFKITSGGVITEIINATGDGTANTLNGAYGIAVDGSENVYVPGVLSDNAFKITGPNIFADDFESGDIGAWSGSTGWTDQIVVTLPGGVPLELLLIPAGSFMMGSPIDERGRIDREDLHAVTLTTSYYVGKYEVTQEQWEAVTGTPMLSDCGSYGVGPSYPVYCVSWDDIAGVGGFIEQLNAYLASTSQPVGFRLPTDAEGERATRAETQSEFSFDVSGNPSWDIDCGSFPEAEGYMWWCGNNDPSGTKEVGAKLSNGYGLHDMHGNVYEWVSDWYLQHLGYDVEIDPTGPATGSDRVSRGGSWGHNAQYCRSAGRYHYAPGDRYDNVGFRLARSQ